MSVEIADPGAVVVQPVRLRTLVWTVFVPMVLYGTGAGAAAPMYALRALDLGASAGLAGVIIALNGLGGLSRA